jgi:hypothetical protein
MSGIEKDVEDIARILIFLYVTGIVFGYLMAFHGFYKRMKKRFKWTKCAVFFQGKP